MYDTILVPTDGSSGTERAVVHGLDLARTYDATVHALFVIDTANLLPIGYLGDRTDFEETIEPLETEAKRAVGEIDDRAREQGVDVLTVVREGSPAETILAYADEADVDLIVMGTHGRRGVSRYVVGSVTERVVRLAKIPVMTVRVPQRE